MDPMRFVVADKNILRRNARDLLDQDPNLAFVLTDFYFMEATKGDAVTNLVFDLNGLSGYWHRVFLGKNHRSIGGFSNEDAIDLEATIWFREALHEGVDAFRDRFLQGSVFESYVSSAETLRSLIVSNHGQMKTAFVTLEDGLHKAEKNLMKRGASVSNETAAYLYGGAMQLTKCLLLRETQSTPMTRLEMSRTFEHRLSLALVLLTLEELESGNRGVACDVMTNNIFDMIYVAFGTFFSGVQSNEPKVNNVAEGVTKLLQVSEILAQPQ
jgi:hypothetical protein